MDDRVGGSLARQRFSALMLTALAGFALLLATVGVYGIVSYQVTQSTRDIGVRIALGADRAAIVGLVVRRGMLLAVVGILVGLVGALALTRLMASLLFGVSAFDPATFAAVPAILGLVALAAVYFPARRAASIDPAVHFAASRSRDGSHVDTWTGSRAGCETVPPSVSVPTAVTVHVRTRDFRCRTPAARSCAARRIRGPG